MTDFMGYVRPDGSVGARNHLLIFSGTVYANRLCDRVADIIYGAFSPEPARILMSARLL